VKIFTADLNITKSLHFFTQCIVLLTQYIVLFTQYIVLLTQYIVLLTQYIVLFTQYIVLLTIRSMHRVHFSVRVDRLAYVMATITVRHIK